MDKDAIDRLIAEEKQLNERIAKLAKFLHDPESIRSDRMPSHEYDALNRQLAVMITYHEILSGRLNRLWEKGID